MKKGLLLFSLLALLFSACKKDDDKENDGNFEDGVFVVNQGAFGTGTGTLTFAANESDTIIQNVYSSVNGGRVLGNVAQSMIEHDDKLFISVNNGGRIVVLKEGTMELVDTITGIGQPRYFASEDDKLYVSSWGTGLDGKVYEIDTKTNTLGAPIIEGNGPEGMVVLDDELFIAKGGGFGRDSVVVVVDTEDNSVKKTIVVGDNPEIIVKSDNDEVIVICKGYTDWTDSSNNTMGKLVRIKDNEIVKSIDIPNGSNKLAIDTKEDVIYYVSEGKVVKRNADLSGEASEVFDLSAYALAFDNEEKLLYIGDAKDYSSRGEVIVLERDGTEKRKFMAGIIPGFFHFD